jgi:hypothetical protein
MRTVLCKRVAQRIKKSPLMDAENLIDGIAQIESLARQPVKKMLLIFGEITVPCASFEDRRQQVERRNSPGKMFLLFSFRAAPQRLGGHWVDLS